MKKGFGTCHGTFGELVQGIVSDQSFLISMPIRQFSSEAMFIPDKTRWQTHSGKSKAKKACELFMEYFKIPISGKLTIYSNIPEGKGLASSSADMIAAIRAIADYYQLTLTPKLLSMLCAEVEPTDPLMYEDVVIYDHRKGILIEQLGQLPRLSLIGIDTGGIIDTVFYNNQTNHHYTIKEKAVLRKAYYLAKKAIAKSYLPDLFEATTLSADINQARLRKPFFAEIKQLALANQGGVIVAHSGTVIGVLIEQQCNEKALQIKEDIYQLTNIEPYFLDINSKVY